AIVPSREAYLGELTPERPRSPQGREQQQVRLVLGQDDAVVGQPADLPADPPFFSRARDRAPRRSAAASRRTSCGATPDGWCPRRAPSRCSVPTAPGGGGPSSSRPDSRTRRGSAPG